jgi:hypothetical protein
LRRAPPASRPRRIGKLAFEARGSTPERSNALVKERLEV